MTFFTAMPKLQEGKKKNPLISTPLYSLGKGLDTEWARQQSRQKSTILSSASIPEVRNGIAFLSSYMEKAIMKTTEVDLDQGILVKHLAPASKSLTD